MAGTQDEAALDHEEIHKDTDVLRKQRALALKATEAQRLRLLHEIGAQRNSAVITYFTSTRPGIGRAGSIRDDDVRVIESHVRAARAAGRQNIDLFLMTRGGESIAPWNLVSMIREYFKGGRLGVIVPSVAYSAGTTISVGADELIMGPASVLGPVDLGFDTERGRQSASEFQGLIDLVAEFGPKGRNTGTPFFEWIARQRDSLEMSMLYRLWKENRRVILNMLESRHHPLNNEHNARIADFLLYGIGIHNQSVRRAEARGGLVRGSGKLMTFITDIESTGLESEGVTLFSLYANIMKIHTPFARPDYNLTGIGGEFDFDANSEHISQTPVAIIESEDATDAAYVVYSLRHWGEVAPVPPQAPPRFTAQPGASAENLREFWVATSNQSVAPPNGNVDARLRRWQPPTRAGRRST